MPSFSCKTARSGSLLAGILVAIGLETIALHLWLMTRHPIVAWALTASSASIILWLCGDYRALGRSAVEVTATEVALTVGWRATARFPLSSIAHAMQPTWRDIPSSAAAGAARYMNLMKPTEPNVLLTLVPPSEVRLPGGLSRAVGRLGLHVDEPQEFISALTEHRTK
jgi:hypothetical protein